MVCAGGFLCSSENDNDGNPTGASVLFCGGAPTGLCFNVTRS